MNKLKHKDGRSLPSYNHQCAVDGKMGLVVAASTTDEQDKPADLFSLVDRAKENAAQSHQSVLADPGFFDYATNLGKIARYRAMRLMAVPV